MGKRLGPVCRSRPGRARPAGSCSPLCTMPRHRLRRSFHPPLALLVGSVAPSISLSAAFCSPQQRGLGIVPPTRTLLQFLPLVITKSEILPLTLVGSSHTPLTAPPVFLSALLHTALVCAGFPSLSALVCADLPLVPRWLAPVPPSFRVGRRRAPPLAAVVRPRRPLSGASPAAAVPLRVFLKPRSRACRSADPQSPVRPTASCSLWSARAVPRTAPVPGAPSEVAAGHRGPWSCAPCARVPGPPALEARSPRGSGPARPLPWKVLESLGP